MKPTSSTASHPRASGCADPSETEELSGLLPDQKVPPQEIESTDTTILMSNYAPLLSPFRLHSRVSMEALRHKREADSPIFESASPGDAQEGKEDVFGTLASLSKSAHGITLAHTKTKQRVIYNRQHSQPPPSTWKSSQHDPYVRMRRHHTSPDGEMSTPKRKEPPPPLTLTHLSPLALKQVKVEQVVSGRPRLPSLQVPPRISSRNLAPIPFDALEPRTPFMAARPAPAPPEAPQAAPRLIFNQRSNNDAALHIESSPEAPRTPSPVNMQVTQLFTRISTYPEDRPDQRPTLMKGMSFFDTSPSPDHTHFRFAPSKATMKAVSGRIRKAVRV